MEDEEVELFDSKLSQKKRRLMLDTYRRTASDIVFGEVTAGLVMI